MQLGDEASTGLFGRQNDEEDHITRNINVSPSLDDDSDAPDFIEQKPYETPLMRRTMKNHRIDKRIALNINEDGGYNRLSSVLDDQDDDNNYHDSLNNLIDNDLSTIISNNFLSHREFKVSISTNIFSIIK